MKYYHSGPNVQEMPEYIFRHSPNHVNLVHPLYQFSLSKWRDPHIPKYDFDVEKLIYRNNSGNEVKREKLYRMTFNAACII